MERSWEAASFWAWRLLCASRGIEGEEERWLQRHQWGLCGEDRRGRTVGLPQQRKENVLREMSHSNRLMHNLTVCHFLNVAPNTGFFSSTIAKNSKAKVKNCAKRNNDCCFHLICPQFWPSYSCLIDLEEKTPDIFIWNTQGFLRKTEGFWLKNLKDPVAVRYRKSATSWH